ncbi:MAG TPA: DUF5060 domain-containing protein [Bryobacteraceae bacterium]|nr:DUF5060 domain-containing protein [Bryobacteraceae bacterium]
MSRPALLMLLLPGLIVPATYGQSTCEGTPAYSTCELPFELGAADAAGRSYTNPYVAIELHVEFRSPHFKTYLMPGFWDGTRNKMIVRFTPTEAGQWTYKVSSNVSGFDGKQGSFNAAASDSPGFVNVANVHHWATIKEGAPEIKQPHLWMGLIADRLSFASAGDFTQQLDAAAQNKFTHIRGSILGSAADRSQVFLAPDRPNPAYFDELDRRIAEIHKRGITTDLMFASDPDCITALFPDAASRERFVRYIVARYAPFNITWQGVAEFEDFGDGRVLLKELGLDVKKIDPYDHPRSSGAKTTSASLLADGWMNYVVEGSGDDAVGSVEHQFYQVPFVGVTDARHVWNATMDGEYPELRGGDLNVAKTWFGFMADTRHWELEPYFDVDGAHAVALDDVEYICYLDHPPGPVEVTVVDHGYDVAWLNPTTGEMVEGKKYKGEHFTGQAPDASHPWVLYVAREGHKESMLKSYKFDSRPVPVQEIETDVKKIPFEIAAPMGNTLQVGKPVQFTAKLTRQTRATRDMMFLWTGEAVVDGRGFRVLGTGASGMFTVPASIAANFPAVLSIHVTALNTFGKAYQMDRVFQLEK